MINNHTLLCIPPQLIFFFRSNRSLDLILWRQNRPNPLFSTRRVSQVSNWTVSIPRTRFTRIERKSQWPMKFSNYWFSIIGPIFNQTNIKLMDCAKCSIFFQIYHRLERSFILPFILWRICDIYKIRYIFNETTKYEEDESKMRIKKKKRIIPSNNCNNFLFQTSSSFVTYDLL